jgi:hypothetical protein
MSSSKRLLFSPANLRLLKNISPKLKLFKNVSSKFTTRNVLNLFTKRELDFFSECVFNVLFHGKKVLSKEHFLLIQYLYLSSSRLVKRNLYYFVFLNCSKVTKISVAAKSYYLIVFIIVLLLPLFEVVLKKF